MNNNTLSAAFSADEQALVMARLYQLLSGQAARYLGVDSTSLPIETAEELLRSLLYTLRLALSQAGCTERDLLTCDLEQLLHQGQRLLLENWFLGTFPTQSVHHLLTRDIPDYADCPLNLCELPLLNAVALTLLEKSSASPVLSGTDLEALTDLLRRADRPDKPEQLGAVMRQALARLLTRLQAPEQAAAYFALLVDNTLPRLQLALNADTLGGIFAV